MMSLPRFLIIQTCPIVRLTLQWTALMYTSATLKLSHVSSLGSFLCFPLYLAIHLSLIPPISPLYQGYPLCFPYLCRLPRFPCPLTPPPHWAPGAGHVEMEQGKQGSSPLRNQWVLNGVAPPNPQIRTEILVRTEIELSFVSVFPPREH